MIPVEKLLSLLPSRLLERLALQYHVDAVNQVRLTGQAVFVCLLTGLANHDLLTLRLLEETYQKLTGRTADHSSFGKRLATIKHVYFGAIFRHLHRQFQTQRTAGGLQGLRLRRVDATTVVLSAKLLDFGIQVGASNPKRSGPGSRHVKAVFTLEDQGLPDLLHVCQEQAEASDNPALGDPMVAATQPGDLWIVDAGLSDRERLLALHQAKGHFLVPQANQKLRCLETLWTAPPETAVLPATGGPGVNRRGAPPPARLLRVERVVFENTVDARSRKRQDKWAELPLLALHCVRWSRRTQQWEPWVLLTNLPLSADQCRAGPFTFVELAELYRRRWDIELFFKFLKGHLSYAHLTSRSENGIRVMIWLALTAAVLLIWYRQVTRIDRGWRSVKFWFAEDLRAWSRQLLEAAGMTVGDWEPG